MENTVYEITKIVEEFRKYYPQRTEAELLQAALLHQQNNILLEAGKHTDYELPENK